jgi:2-iminobutanoate/2-iminopropanoate deaminase
VSSSSDAIPVGPYAPIARAGDLLVCSGQLGLCNGSLVEGGLAAELPQAFSNLVQILASEGATLDDVVKMTVFLTDIADFEEMNSLYLEAFGDHRPTRSAFAVAALPRGGCVEIEAWAYAPLVH